MSAKLVCGLAIDTDLFNLSYLACNIYFAHAEHIIIKLKFINGNSYVKFKQSSQISSPTIISQSINVEYSKDINSCFFTKTKPSQ